MRLGLRTAVCSLLMLGMGLGLSLSMQGAGEVVTVYKLATCGCCKAWVEHMKQNGFTVVAHDVPDTAVYRKKFGIPESLQSCHTAVVGKYAIEGHVPASEIKRLLKEKPAARGLSAPGMPLGSPGMEAAKASRRDAYSVLVVAPSGQFSVYRAYPASE